jgi:TorA maturation chaperone TorD
MRLKTFILGAAIAAGVAMTVPASAAPLGLAPMMQSPDTAIRRAFQGVLTREPTAAELRRYRVLMNQYNWTEADVRKDLRDRPDYQRYSNNRNTMRPEAIIRTAYQDILGRDPDPEGLRTYRTNIVDRGWSEQDVREALRNSPEYASGAFRDRSADRIIRRAYQDILHREPDPEGMANYRRNIVQDGWDEQDVRQALRKSDERRGAVRGGNSMSDAQATDIVRRAYQSVLKREPDDVGMREYKARVLNDRWTEQQVRDALRKSDERRDVVRGQNTVSDAQAADIVRRAYQSMLNREPDDVGMRDYKARILNDRWTEQQVRDALRNSDEYRSKH